MIGYDRDCCAAGRLSLPRLALENEERVTLLLDSASDTVLDFAPKWRDQNFEAFGIDAKIHEVVL
jgi:hypothetical protein